MRIIALLLSLLISHAQAATVFPGPSGTTQTITGKGLLVGENWVTNDRDNYVQNSSAFKSATGVTASGTGASVSRNTTTPLGEVADFSINLGTTSSGYAEWNVRTLPSGLAGQNCALLVQASTLSKGTATVVWQVLQSSAVVGSVEMPTSSVPLPVSLPVPCGASANLAATKIRVSQTAYTSGTTALKVSGVRYGDARAFGVLTDAANITSWKTVPSYAAITNGGTGTQTTTVEQARVGDTAWFRVGYGATGAGSGTGNILTFNLPPGLLIDTAKLSNVANQQAAVGSGFFTSGQTGTRTALSARVTLGSNTQVRFPFNGLTRDMSSADFDASGNVGFLISLPIANWPTASSAVTPASQNVWGGARFVAAPQYVSTTSSTKTILNNSAFSAPTLFGTATAASSTCGLTTNDIGLCIPSLPAGTYRVVANTVARATTTANCQYDLTLGGQIVTGAELQAQATSETSNIATISGLVTITSALANTSSTIRVARNSGSGNCGVVVDNGTNAEKYPTIDFSAVQSNVSPVFIQSPVRAAQTGVAPNAGEVGEEISASRTTIFTQAAPTAGTYYDVTGLSITLTPGVWDVFVYSATQSDQSSATGQHLAFTSLRTGSTTIQDVISSSGVAQASSPTFAHSFSKRVSVTTSTAYKVSIAYANFSGTPTITNIYSRGDLVTGGSYIRATRVGDR
jgi:hypothetical protein